MSLDEQTRAFLKKANENPSPSPREVSLQEFRDGVRALEPLNFDQEDVGEVRDVNVSSFDGTVIQTRLYSPRAEAVPPLLICAHGGSWARLDVNQMDPYYRVLTNRSGCAVAAVDFRLAPEATFPAQIEEVHAVARWAQNSADGWGWDPARIGIFGESSGGNLAAAAALLARDRGDVDYALQVLLLPVLDLRFDSPSWDRLGSGYLLTKEQLAWAVEQYAPGMEPTEPLLSPLLAPDLSGLPPAVIMTGEYDPLRDDGERYAAALGHADVKVHYECMPGLIHHAILVAKAIPLGAQVLDRVGALIRDQLGVAQS